MNIQKIHIKGFRNFEDEEITFQNKTLIIGANDVGKTNLIFALRLLFDKSISDRDLELSDSDYNAYSGAQNIEITATITDIAEECLLSAFGGHVKDGRVLIRYTNSKTDVYHIFIGFSEETLEETSSRQYLRRLNMQSVDTNRDLFSFLSRERAQLLRIAKENLTEAALAEDNKHVADIQSKLNDINTQVSSMHYISSALNCVNQELSKLSSHNEDQTVRFVAGESDVGRLLDKLTLAYASAEQPLVLGGDGRNNQIFLATWIAKQNLQKSIDHVTFYAVEEPEAHLHPHQQRKLSEYLQQHFSDQVFITTHSPHISARFDPRNIVRLYTDKKMTHASCGGCSSMLSTVFSDFGYRLNALSAEVFFADGVFLVEGPSEVLFYHALAQELQIDLDRLNITILSVDGIGFKPYVAVCNALSIPWVLRTDNDIFSRPTNAPVTKYYAGVSRIMGILEDTIGSTSDLVMYWTKHKAENEWPKDAPIPEAAQKLNTYIGGQITSFGCYLSDKDLECDLINSPLLTSLQSFYGRTAEDSLAKAMKARKAENMLDYLTQHRKSLSLLISNPLSFPLQKLERKVKERIHPDHGKSAD